MHHPPDAQFSVDTHVWADSVVFAFSVLAVLQTSWFFMVEGYPFGGLGAAVTLCFVACTAAWLWTARRSRGVLRWGNLQWQWSGSPGANCGVRLHLDFQKLLLVCVHCESNRPVWLWFHASENPGEWLPFRRALVYSSSDHQKNRQVQPVRDEPQVTAK